LRLYIKNKFIHIKLKISYMLQLSVYFILLPHDLNNQIILCHLEESYLVL
jgi:hypothetical protein